MYVIVNILYANVNIGGKYMSKKIYVGTFEFDKEEKEIITDALLSYSIISKRLNPNYNETCNYILAKFKDLKEEQF